MKWKKPTRKGYILYDSISDILETQIYWDSIKIGDRQGMRKVGIVKLLCVIAQSWIQVIT